MLELVSSRLGRRLAATVGLAMAALGFGGLGVLLDQERRLRAEAVDHVLEAAAAGIAASFNTYDARLGRHPIADVAAELGGPTRQIHLEVFDATGQITWSTDPNRRPTSTEDSVTWPLPKRASCLPCHDRSPDPIGKLQITAEPKRLLAERASYERLAIATAVLVILLLTALILLLANRMVIDPLGRLVRVMGRVEEGDFLARAEVRANDEIGLLASTFNKLIAKITDLRVERIDTEREMSGMRDELALKSELQVRIDQLSFLYAVSKELAAELDPEKLLTRLGELISASIGVPELACILLDPSGARATLAGAYGFAEGMMATGRSFRIEGSVSADAVRTREPIYVADLADDDRHIAYRLAPAKRGSLLCVPVILQDRVIGTMSFSSPEPDAIPPDRRELLVAVAHQGALALANAQLFRETLELSRTDGLTGIPNRRELESRLQIEWSSRERYQAPLSIVMIDIDHFKHYNDEHGHQKGDEVLRKVAGLLEAQVRKSDLVGRYGGEEFMAVLPHTDREHARIVAEKLRRAIEQADFEGGYHQPLGRVTISCGVATSPGAAETLEALVHAADDALFAAKDGGRNQVKTAAQL